MSITIHTDLNLQCGPVSVPHLVGASLFTSITPVWVTHRQAPIGRWVCCVWHTHSPAASSTCWTSGWPAMCTWLHREREELCKLWRVNTPQLKQKHSRVAVHSRRCRFKERLSWLPEGVCPADWLRHLPESIPEPCSPTLFLVRMSNDDVRPFVKQRSRLRGVNRLPWANSVACQGREWMRNLLTDSASTLYVPSVLFPIVLSVSLEHASAFRRTWNSILAGACSSQRAVICPESNSLLDVLVLQFWGARLDLTLITSGVKGPAGD